MRRCWRSRAAADRQRGTDGGRDQKIVVGVVEPDIEKLPAGTRVVLVEAQGRAGIT
jgi:hypothetical protein